MITVDDIKAHGDAVKSAVEALNRAKLDLSKVRELNGQNGCSISVNGVCITVTSTCSKTYLPKMIRGREMIHLGALKALESLKDYAEEKLKYESERLAEITEKFSLQIKESIK